MGTEKKINGLFLLIAFAIILSLGASAVPTVTQHGVTISSSKETYFCEPVTSPDGCLIQSKVFVENNNNNPINAFLEFDSNQEVKIRQFRNAGQRIATEKSKGKNLHSKIPYLIGKDEIKEFDIEFYTHNSGKFNFSIFFGGNRVILDPFFNTTFNNTNPTLHLDSGRVTSYNDSEFIIIQNLSNELNDLNDLTNFETSRTQFSTNALLSFLYQGTSSYFGEVQARGDGANASENMDGVTRYFEANLVAPITNGDEIEIHFQDSASGSPSSTGTIYITNTAQTINYANFTSTEDAETYFLTMQNINTTTSSFRIHADVGDDTGDKELIDLVRVGETVDGQALRVSYPVTINTNNDYFLRVKKVSSGTEDIQVMYYVNGTGMVDTIIANETFSPGYTHIPLSVHENRSASFRVFSAVIEEISEVFLIEIIEDIEAPVILNHSVSPVQLFCNDEVTFEVNATDDNFIDFVEVTYNVSGGNLMVENADFIFDDTYRAGHVYNFLDPTNGSYSLSKIRVVDLAGIETVELPNSSYAYFCNDTSLLPPPAPVEAYTIGICPNSSLTSMLLFMFFVMIAFGLMILAPFFKSGLIGLLGSMTLLILSFYLWACIWILGLILAGVAILTATLFVFRGVKGDL